VLGALLFLWPRAYWRLQTALLVKGGEPTTFALVFYRVAGASLVIGGVAMMVTAF
jgi:hypothetical protein